MLGGWRALSLVAGLRISSLSAFQCIPISAAFHGATSRLEASATMNIAVGPIRNLQSGIIGNPKLPHWITSSARTGTDCSTVRLRALAVVSSWISPSDVARSGPPGPSHPTHGCSLKSPEDVQGSPDPPLWFFSLASISVGMVARSAESYRPRFRLAGCASAWYRPTNKNRGEEGARALGWVPRPCCATRVPIARCEGSGSAILVWWMRRCPEANRSQGFFLAGHGRETLCLAG